jgi:RNA polymerase sigma-70 factor (ECF subfamily)
MPANDDRAQDSLCLQRLQAGEEGALEQLYDRYGALAYTLALRMLGDSHQAEDVVQDAFLSIWRNADRYDPTRSSFRVWFLAIVRNRCFDKLRGRSVRPQLTHETEVADTPGGDDVAGAVSQSIEAQTVRDALSHLPLEQRQTIELAYYHGLSQSEISRQMAVPLGTVKGRVRMAMQKLRETLSGLELESSR